MYCFAYITHNRRQCYVSVNWTDSRLSCCPDIYWRCPHSMQQGVYNGTVSVCLFVCPIYRPLHAAAAGLLLYAGQAGDDDRQRRPPGAAAARRSAANAGSVTLSADVGSWTRTCFAGDAISLPCMRARVWFAAIFMRVYERATRSELSR